MPDPCSPGAWPPHHLWGLPTTSSPRHFPQAFLTRTAAPTLLTLQKAPLKPRERPTPTQCCFFPWVPRESTYSPAPLPHGTLPIISLLSLPAFPFPAPSPSLHPPLPHLKRPRNVQKSGILLHPLEAGRPSHSLDGHLPGSGLLLCCALWCSLLLHSVPIVFFFF